MRKLSSNCCPSSVDRCDGMTEETESCTLESAVRGHHVYKTTWSPAIGQVLQVRAEDSNAYDRYAVATCLRDTVGAEDSNAYDRCDVATCLCDTVVEIIGGVAFPGARGHFNFFFVKCFSLANSQKFDSRINNRLYGIMSCTEKPYYV